MNIHTLTLGSFQTNCYILEEDGRCLIIDPGYEPETLLQFVDARGLNIQGILLTHGHFDHVGAVEKLVEAAGCPLYMHQADHSQPAVYKMLYPLTGKGNPVFVEEGDCLPMGISLLETPGHTPGSVCYFTEDALFSGDTLFAGTCGRTDLPGGSAKALRGSLARLAALEKDYTVYPGHGESTTLAAEKRYNPYM